MEQKPTSISFQRGEGKLEALARAHLLAIRAVAVVSLLVALTALATVPSRYPKFPIDAYYYLEMARNVAHGKGPVVRFEQGFPLKFFPGYPLVLGIASLAGEPDEVWQFLHAGLVVGLFLSILWTGRNLGISAPLSWATAALTFSSPVFLKWVTLPYSELLTLTLGVLIAGVSAKAIRTLSATDVTIAGFLGSFAAITRPTAGFYVLAAAFYLLLYLPKQIRLRCVARFLTLCAILPLLYLASRWMNHTSLVPYAHELSARGSDDTVLNRFLSALICFSAIPKVASNSAALEWLLTGSTIAFMMSVVLSLRGYLGIRVLHSGLIVVAFLALHSFWNYSSERFILPVLPAGMFVTARCMEWFCDREKPIEAFSPPKRFAFLFLVVGWCATMWGYAPVVIENHITALRHNTGHPRELAQVANSQPHGIAWIEIGPEFAYFYKGTTYFGYDEPFFYSRSPKEEVDYFGKRHVRWVITKDSPEEWCRKHPHLDGCGKSFRLRRETDDGLWTLYRVEYLLPPLVPQK